MNIQTATQEYEAWLGKRTTLVQAYLDFKHQQMAAGVFPFLRSRHHLGKRPKNWLTHAVKAMTEATEQD